MIPEGFIPTQRVESQLSIISRNVSWILVLMCCVSPSENVFAQSDTRMIKEPMIGVGLASGLMDLTVAAKNSVIKVQKRREILRFESPLFINVRAQSVTIGDYQFSEPIRIRAEEGLMMVDGRSLTGWVEFQPLSRESGGWEVIERIPMEQYLLGVVSKEVSAESFPMASLKAQAIASRTYAYFHVLSRPGKRRHVHSTVRSQVYGGLSDIPEKIRQAVEETRGQVLIHSGKIFESFFHSTCGGATCSGVEAFGLPSLEVFSSVRCEGCTTSKYFRWELEAQESVVRSALLKVEGVDKISLGKIQRIEPVDRASSGHVAYFKVQHGKGSFEVSANSLRFGFSSLKTEGKLRSQAFDVQSRGDKFVFRGRGWGHGVGMCQMGARGYARSGWLEDQILQHFYRGTEIRRLW